MNTARDVAERLAELRYIHPAQVRDVEQAIAPLVERPPTIRKRDPAPEDSWTPFLTPATANAYGCALCTAHGPERCAIHGIQVSQKDDR